MNKTGSIVKQASILALAGIFVRIIGVLYRSPLTELITTEGIGYYSTAYTIYAMILLISSYSIPSAISKLISEKLILNQYNNVQKILKCSFIYICAIGGGTAIVTFFLAPYIVTKDAALALQVLCPTIFLSGLLGVFRGYFQAHQTTVYTSVSQILEQVFNAIVSIGAAYLFIQPFISVGGTKLASVGAAGSALGTGAGVLVGLAFMLFMYMKKKNTLVEKTEYDNYEDSYKDIFKMILNIVTPIIFATCVYNLASTIDMYLLYFALGDSISTTTAWGLYTGQYMLLQNVPVALASAMSTASIPAISSLWAIKDKKQARKHITSGIRVTMLILIPSTIGISVLGYPIIGLIFPQKETVLISSYLLMFGSSAIVFFGLSTFTNGILQAIGEVNIPLRNAGIALIWHCILVIILLFFTPLGIYSLIIGNCTYGLHVCILNQKALHHKVRYKGEIRRTYLLPLLASIIMGIIVGISYFGLFMITKKVFIPLVISVILGVVTYFVIILYMYAEHPAELEAIPCLNRLVYKIKKR